jgi:hypothetical protein
LGSDVPRRRDLRQDEGVAQERAGADGLAGNEHGADISVLPTFLGIDFLCYCTNTGEAELVAFFERKSTLPAPASGALNELASISSAVLKQSVEHNTPVDLLWDIFSVRRDGEATMANLIRINAGGEIITPRSQDDLLRELQIVAIDLYPLFLIPPSGSYPIDRISATRPLLSHPSIEILTDLISADADLQTLYPQRHLPEVAGESNRVARILMSQVPRLIETLTDYAYYSAALKLGRVPSLDEYCEEVVTAFRVARTMAKGWRVSLPVAIGLANLKLPPGSIIESAAGRLIPYSHAYDRLAPMQARQYKVNLHSDQGEHQFSGVGDIVCHALVKFKLDIQSHPGGVTGWQLKEVTAQDLGTKQAAICLAATLSIKHELPIAVDPVWVSILSPISPSMPGPWRNDYSLRRAMAPLRVLADQQANDWREWISRITTNGFGTLAIAARRLQSAIAERTSPVDRFVDSVMIWENMFGSGGDVSLRIAISLAWFLGTSQLDRANLYEAANNLYRLRSQVVHGGAQLSDGDAAISAERALDIAIRGLRTIYESRPELISVSARDRSLCAMLQTDADSLRSAQKSQKSQKE